MVRRTTIEIDEELLTRARHALGSRTIRETVEEALRRVADAGEDAETSRAARQREFLGRLLAHIDAEVLSSEDMWQ